ncbi:hypothetical protein [Kushneria aurantia]|uniref:hypothetical protein n=1 Tax=Kushneria aurantia TaxID=504092 RepID=UPI000369DEAB|nr:hypothetical protein [Kushneria aurantia]
MDPHIAVKREVHHTPPLERFTEPMPLAEGSSPTERMSHKLQTRAGRAVYALRTMVMQKSAGAGRTPHLPTASPTGC